jgi:16S rRNA processing protein RimM
VRVAHVRRAHGLRGELLVRPFVSRPEELFVPGREFFSHPEDDSAQARVRSARSAGDGWLIGFDGVADRTAADAWRGRDLWLAREAFEALGDEPQPLDDLLGLELFLADGTRIGEVSSFYDLPQGPMLEITRAEDTVLFPLHEDFIVEMDVPGRRLVVAPPPGLFD